MITLLKVGQESCRERLAEYFEELYNVLAHAERLAANVLRTAVAPDSPIREDPPSYQVVEKVVSVLKGGLRPTRRLLASSRKNLEYCVLVPTLFNTCIDWVGRRQWGRPIVEYS